MKPIIFSSLSNTYSYIESLANLANVIAFFLLENRNMTSCNCLKMHLYTDFDVLYWGFTYEKDFASTVICLLG